MRYHSATVAIHTAVALSRETGLCFLAIKRGPFDYRVGQVRAHGFPDMWGE